MAIAFLLAAGNASVATGATLAITLSPATGSTVVVVTDALIAAGAVVSVIDDKGSVYTKQSSAASSLNTTECWSTSAGGILAGVTTITVTWTTAHIERTAIASSYSGVIGIGQHNTNTGTSSPMTVSITTQDSNNFVVAGLGAGALETVTVTVGNQRSTTQGTTVALACADNTSVAPASVADTATLSTGTSWAAAAVELKTLIIIGTQDTDYQLDRTVLNYNFQSTVEDWNWSNLLPLSASDIILMSYFGYSALPGSKEDPAAWTQEIIISLNDFTWDNDADQQFTQPSPVSYTMLQLNEYSYGDYTEQPSPGTVVAWDNDSDNQLQQSGYTFDIDLVDTAVELITITAVWDTDSDNQLSQLQLNPLNYNFQVTDEEYKYSVLNPISITDIILMGYYGYSVLPGTREDPTLWIPLIITIPTITDYTWDDDQQIPQIGWNFDSIEDQAQFVLLEVYDDDGEQQFSQPMWATVGDFDDRNTLPQYSVGVITGHDNDGDMQFQQSGWQQDGDVDTTITRILVPQAFDNDYDNQIGQAAWSLDVIEEQAKLIIVSGLTDFTWDETQDIVWIQWSVDQIEEQAKRIFIPVLEIDNDSEQQIQQADYYRDTLSDEGEELPQPPITVSHLNAWDTDTEQQLQWSPLFGQDDVSDSSVELLPAIFTASDIIIMSYSGYWISPPTDIDQDVEKITLPPVVIVSYTWDDPSDNQLMQALWLGDDVIDTGVELIILPPYINIDEIVGEEED